MASIRRVLLIDVEFDRNRENQKHGQYQSGWSHHPIGLMYWAATARKAVPGIKVRVAHTVTFENAEIEIAALIDEFQPELIGLRALSLFQNQFRTHAQAIRSRFPAIPLISGGPFPSASWREILAEGIVDLVVIGEGEVTFAELLEHLGREGELPKGLSGTAVIGADGKPHANCARSLIADVDSLPFPAYDLLDFQRYEGISNLAFQTDNRLGDLTYAIYLVHRPQIGIIVLAGFASSPLAWLFGLVIVVLAAMLLHIVCEVPPAKLHNAVREHNLSG